MLVGSELNMKKFSLFDELYPLKVGNKRQQQAYKILQDTQILLESYTDDQLETFLNEAFLC